jgi:hypothetical protein
MQVGLNLTFTMSSFIKINASRLKNCNIFLKNVKYIEYSMHFIKMCNLQVIYFTFGMEIVLKMNSECKHNKRNHMVCGQYLNL